MEDRYLDLEHKIADPDVIADQDAWQKAMKAHAELEEVVTAYREYKNLLKQRDDAKTLLDDADFGEMAKDELRELEPRILALEERLRILLLPKDPNDNKNVIVEIRGGTGGDEAALFAADLFRMYSRYAEGRGWRVEVMDSNITELGGYKEVVFMVNGDNEEKQEAESSSIAKAPEVEKKEPQKVSATPVIENSIVPIVEKLESKLEDKMAAEEQNKSVSVTLIIVIAVILLFTVALCLFFLAKTKKNKSESEE